MPTAIAERKTKEAKQKESLQIQWSNDYKKLKLFKFNRTIDEKRVEKIASLIQEYGFVLPILVTKNLEILDGQHRYEASKLCGSSYSYIILDIEDKKIIPIIIAHMNSSSKNWVIADYFDMWFKLGKKDFIEAKNFYESLNFTFKEFLIIVRFMSKLIRNGEFEFTDTLKDRVKLIADQLKEVFKIDKWIEGLKTNESFRSSLISLMLHGEYDHGRLMKYLPQHTGRIPQSPGVFSFGGILEEIYNTHMRKNRLRLSSR